MILPIFSYLMLKDKIYVYNEVEKPSLYIIATSEDDIVAFDTDRPIVSWEPLYYPEESKYYGELLYLWKITDKPKLYYNLPKSNDNQ
jgi:hypothetical protein